MLNSIFTGSAAAPITMSQLLICTLCSLALGCVMAWIHTYKNQYSSNFIITLALLPAIVQSVIMLVNGNLGTGVAVMGAFSLIRFRSAPGDSREIGSIFLAMAIGLATGMGYLGIAVILLVIIGSATLIFSLSPLGHDNAFSKELKITVPENLDYCITFDDIFQTFTAKADLLRVRTVQMGSLYELLYQVKLLNPKAEKEFLDAIRCRNGNLTIVLSQVPSDRNGL